MKNKKIFISMFILVIILIVVGIVFININKNSLNNENKIKENNNIKNLKVNLDYIYSNEAIGDNIDIREIPKDYTVKQALKDNCYVEGYESIKDCLNNPFEEFEINYNNKKSAFARLIKFTTEGDMIISDIFYDNEQNKVFLIRDTTRDGYGIQAIKIYEFEKFGKYKEHCYINWVLYNGELNKDTYQSDNVWLLTRYLFCIE